MRFEQLGKANKSLVAEGVERLRLEYESFIHEKQKQGVDFTFIDGQMIGHNFYKLILSHIASESGDDIKMWMRLAVDTLTKAMNEPVTNETDPDMS